MSTTTTSSSSSSSTRSFSLIKETELRFEIEDGWTLTIQLQRGSGELFGVPLTLHEQYELTTGRFSIWTWYGCEIVLTEKKLVGDVKTKNPLSDAYIPETSDVTSMIATVNVHARLEKEREEAQVANRRGPVTIICGSTDSGKSTLCRTLLAYATRKGRRPIFIDLDPGQGEISPPGTLSAVTVDVDSLSVEAGPSSTGALVYFFGHLTPDTSLDMYRRLVERINSVVEARFALDPASQCSGMIINTCGWTEGEGYKLLLHICRSFHANLILVMGQADKLARDLKNDLVVTTPTPTTTDTTTTTSSSNNQPSNVVKMPISSGVQSRSKEYRKRTRDYRIREYFYGSLDGPELSPHVITVNFDQVIILKAPAKGDIPAESMRPVGKPMLSDATEFHVMEPSAALQHSILGVSLAMEKNEVPYKNVAGFVHVQSIDMEHKQIKLLSPQQGNLPSKFLICGSVKWVGG
jgi:polyribonucleotide 5'-hydroxyl-kinase